MGVMPIILIEEEVEKCTSLGAAYAPVAHTACVLALARVTTRAYGSLASISLRSIRRCPLAIAVQYARAIVFG